ncbi:MAG: DUF975 family protein [Clostridia bacterium]|nr:DUF975 family protein [Clostridia bacterium]
MDRKQLKAQAKEQIRGKIGVLIAVTLVIGAITAVATFLAGLIPGVGMAVSLIVTPAFALSTIRIYLMVVRGGNPEIKDSFSGFDDFFSAFKVTFLVGLYTFLWSLLFIIPGIIKSYSYSMSMFVLADNKGKSARECIAESKAMTEGHKMELFVLDLSFIGWYLLGSLTCGIAYLYVVPLLNATHANVYETIKPVVAVPFETVENTEEAPQPTEEENTTEE